jgi:hypothetical protein
LSDGALQADDGQDVFVTLFFLLRTGGFCFNEAIAGLGCETEGNWTRVALWRWGIGGIIPRWDAQHLPLINQLPVLFVKSYPTEALKLYFLVWEFRVNLDVSQLILVLFFSPKFMEV